MKAKKLFISALFAITLLLSLGMIPMDIGIKESPAAAGQSAQTLKATDGICQEIRIIDGKFYLVTFDCTDGTVINIIPL